MRKIVTFILLILFLYNNDTLIVSSMEALNIWAEKIFPILFPTFILSDLLISSGIPNLITKYFGELFSKIFKTSPYGLYILLISLLSGTPTNAKNLNVLYKNNYINTNSLNKIMAMFVFFNPLLIIKLTSLKIYIIIIISNIITGLITRNKLTDNNTNYKYLDIKFDLSKSIEININILLNILGTITVFLILANILPIKNIYIKTIISGLLEITNGLNKTNLLIENMLLKEIFYVTFISFGGLSILIQIKSILKDTFNFKTFLLSRVLCTIISVIFVCICT